VSKHNETETIEQPRKMCMICGVKPPITGWRVCADHMSDPRARAQFINCDGLGSLKEMEEKERRARA
jgi:hypothetical protein